MTLGNYIPTFEVWVIVPVLKSVRMNLPATLVIPVIIMLVIMHAAYRDGVRDAREIVSRPSRKWMLWIIIAAAAIFIVYLIDDFYSLPPVQVPSRRIK